MTDPDVCKHDEINLVRTDHVHFCTQCSSTISQVTGAIRNMHGKVTGNITTPGWEPQEAPATEEYERFDLSEPDDLGGLVVDVFADGSIHIFDREPPTEEQVSLKSPEVERLLHILQSRKPVKT